MVHPGRGLARVLVILATIAALVAAVAGWADGQALDEEGWRTTSEELVAEPSIRAALAEHLAGEITDAVRVPPFVVAGLPGTGDSQGAVRRGLAVALERAMDRPEVQAALIAAVVDAHGLAVEALRGGGPRVDSADGVVALDLDAVLRAGLEAQISGGERLARLLPEGLGRVEIADAADLEPAQVAVDRVETAARFAPLLALALLGLALIIAGSARRGILLMAGVLALIAGVGLVLARVAIGEVIVQALADEPRYREAAGQTWDIASDGLARNGIILAVIGGVLLLAAIAYSALAGMTRPTDGDFGRAGGPDAAGGAHRPDRSDGGARDWSIGSDPRGDATAQRIARARELYKGGAMSEADYRAEVERIRREG